MKPQFITNCLLEIKDADTRNYVVQKLIEMGRRDFTPNVFEVDKSKAMLAFSDCFTLSMNKSCPPPVERCTDIPTFLDLAAMRSDTYADQLMMCESRYTDPKLDYSIVEPGTIIRFGDFDEYAKAFYHRATAQEIIQWHKLKGGKE